jgi:predicted HicB family RNase H-like nuclease
MIEYKGYIGTVEYDAQAKLFHGDIVNTRDVITFQGTTVQEIEKAFRDSINDYLAWYQAEGEAPEKPCSGKFSIRLSPELHQAAVIAAKKLKLPINRFVEKAISDELVLLRPQ